MAINFPTMPRFTPEETGAMPDLQQAIMQGLGNYMQLQTQPKQMAQDFLAKQLTNKMKGIEAQYAEPMAQQDLQSKLLQNKYYPRMQESSLATSGLNRDLLKRQLAAQDLDIELRNRFNNLIRSGQYGQMGGQQNAPQNDSRQEFQGIPFKAPEQQPSDLKSKIQTGISKPNQTVVAPGNPNLYGLDAALEQDPFLKKFAKQQGFEKSVTFKQNNNTGETIMQTVLPSGKTMFESIQVGKTPGAVRFEEKEAEQRAKSVQESSDLMRSIQDVNDNLDSAIDTFNQNIESMNVVGKGNKPATELFGTPEQKQLLGQLESSFGNIVVAVGSNIKGPMTGGERALINQMKPNTNEPVDIAIAKMQTLREANEIAYQREKIYAEAIRTGIPQDKAREIARQQVSLAPVREHFNKILATTKARSLAKSAPTKEKQEALKGYNNEDLYRIWRGGK